MSARVLVVDDDRLMADELFDIARDVGMEVRVAHTVAAAREIVDEDWRPHVILLDQRLDGIEAPDTGLVRQIGSFSRVPRRSARVLQPPHARRRVQHLGEVPDEGGLLPPPGVVREVEPRAVPPHVAQPNLGAGIVLGPAHDRERLATLRDAEVRPPALGEQLAEFVCRVLDVDCHVLPVGRVGQATADFGPSSG
jgi:hypothetical protein